MSRIIFLEDLENYVKWFREQQIAQTGEPQAIIQPSVLETFAEWVRKDTDSQTNTELNRELVQPDLLTREGEAE